MDSTQETDCVKMNGKYFTNTLNQRNTYLFLNMALKSL